MKIKFKHILYASLIVALIIPIYFSLEEYFTHKTLTYGLLFRCVGFIFTFLVTISIAGVNIQIVYLCQKKITWDKYFLRRAVIELFITSITAALIISAWVAIFTSIFPSFQAHHKENVYFSNIVVAIIVNAMATFILEGIYMFNQWKSSLVETEKLKRENIESQFAVLKNQVNPHFLFNSLNALSSLISQSPAKAKEFVNQFSKVYRYVLEVKDKLVVEIKEELDFLNSYYFLQKIRHGENLNMIIEIDAQKVNYFIPALSLQILVENAIKHNEISSKYPLTIELYNDEKYLIVKNNIQNKNINIETSTGIGLKNLTERYSHFSDIAPVFTVKNQHYIAKLPIIKEE